LSWSDVIEEIEGAIRLQQLMLAAFRIVGSFGILNVKKQQKNPK
jgi:hypothetical protein